ncbi:hypothetical protein LTR05_006954 [Lithohypha guttulata]|uniref:Uncharacterized protein n=1 Tax=Lithohypha guttulata TaxID=1690604 RepID=A0AAN7SWA2_9EURO|nr:hypothetical protein LTR05_006954 [Lithohypha guttulata]
MDPQGFTSLVHIQDEYVLYPYDNREVLDRFALLTIIIAIIALLASCCGTRYRGISTLWQPHPSRKLPTADSSEDDFDADTPVSPSTWSASITTSPVEWTIPDTAPTIRSTIDGAAELTRLQEAFRAYRLRSEQRLANQQEDFANEQDELATRFTDLHHKIQQLMSSRGLEIRTRAQGRFLASLEIETETIDTEEFIKREQEKFAEEKTQMQREYDHKLSELRAQLETEQVFVFNMEQRSRALVGQQRDLFNALCQPDMLSSESNTSTPTSLRTPQPESNPNIEAAEADSARTNLPSNLDHMQASIKQMTTITLTLEQQILELEENYKRVLALMEKSWFGEVPFDVYYPDYAPDRFRSKKTPSPIERIGGLEKPKQDLYESIEGDDDDDGLPEGDFRGIFNPGNIPAPLSPMQDGDRHYEPPSVESLPDTPKSPVAEGDVQENTSEEPIVELINPLVPPPASPKLPVSGHRGPRKRRPDSIKVPGRGGPPDPGSPGGGGSPSPPKSSGLPNGKPRPPRPRSVSSPLHTATYPTTPGSGFVPRRPEWTIQSPFLADFTTWAKQSPKYSTPPPPPPEQREEDKDNDDIEDDEEGDSDEEEDEDEDDFSPADPINTAQPEDDYTELIIQLSKTNNADHLVKYFWSLKKSQRITAFTMFRSQGWKAFCNYMLLTGLQPPPPQPNQQQRQPPDGENSVARQRRLIAERQFRIDFPNGHRIIPTSGAGDLCAPEAAVNSWRAQKPGLPAMTVAQLQLEVQNLMRNTVLAKNFGIEATYWGASQLALAVHKWGSQHNLNIQLGCFSPGILTHLETFKEVSKLPVIYLWVHNDNRHQEVNGRIISKGHWSGLGHRYGSGDTPGNGSWGRSSRRGGGNRGRGGNRGGRGNRGGGRSDRRGARGRG